MKEKIKKLEENIVNIVENKDKQNKEIIGLKEDNKKLKNEINEILVLKEELKSIIEKQNNENKNLKEKIKNLRQNYEEFIKQNKNKELNENKLQNLEKKEIKNKINVNSVIMKNEEFDMIKNAIESRLNKKVKEVKKLYQATVDGGEIANFHSKCDNIPNTLTIIQSEGNRRFGGFTSESWVTELIYKDDKNAFLFSLDKRKIYLCKNGKFSIFCADDFGPSFGTNQSFFCTIGITGNPIKNKNLYTYESDSSTYDFNGDGNALSEDGKGNKIYAKEYEVFQIIS